MRKLFLRLTIDTVGPIESDIFQVGIIRNSNAEANGSIGILS
jgi:hypothetical protein